MASFSDYSSNAGAVQAPGNVSAPTDSGDKAGYWSLARLKRAYLDYLGTKRDEILEQQDSRRYRHSSQWTADQVKIFNLRKQPVVTYNRIAPKINGIVGLIEKLRQAPKAYPRTPNEAEGADLATAVVRYVVDEQQFKVLSPFCGQDAAIDGLSGIEITLEQGDQGDPEIGLLKVEGDSFFYDPRSYSLDFADCRYMGQAKWVDMDAAKEMFPDKAEELEDAAETGWDLSTNSDRENKWFISNGDTKRVRIVDHWYMMKGEWCYCIYTGSMKLQEGKSFLVDEKGKSFCKYLMFSANVDQDGDRYGFVRQFKSAQDEINQRRSKSLHTLMSRRIIAEDGAFDDIEKTRQEAVRPDGVIIRNKGFEAEFDDAIRMQETEAQLKFLQEAKEELDSYGPTLSLVGDVGQNQSGRAISLQQQAGIAQLGPFMVSYRAWKLRVYRAIWNAVRQHWKAERWVRVTDDQNATNFVGLNQVGIHPQTGMPTMVNQISALDVDIIMDEGPDTINMMADTFDALNALAQSGAQIPPAILLELAPGIDSQTRQRLIQQMSQPDPMQQQAQQIELAHAQAKVQETQAATQLKGAQAADTLRGDQGAGAPQEHPLVTAANVENTMADTEHKKAQTMKARTEALLAPQQQAHEQQMSENQAQTDAMQMDHDKVRRENDFHNMKIQEHQMTMRERQAKLDAAKEDRAAVKHKSDSIVKTDEGLVAAIQGLAQAANVLAKSADSINTSATALAKAASAPRKIVRGKDGRATHVEVGGGS